MTDLLTLDAAWAQGVGEVGGKAWHTARLSRLPGVRTAKSRVVACATVHAVVGQVLAPRAALDDEDGNARALAGHARVQGWARDAAGAFPRAGLLIVRSSGASEDGTAQSLAGHYESVVVKNDPEALATAFGRVMAQALHTYARHVHEGDGPAGWDAAARSFALLVQPVVDGEKSGVCFSRSPFGPDEALVVAGWGSCHGVVDGRMVTDTFVVGRDEDVRSAELRYKFEMTALDEHSAHRLTGEEVPTQLGPCVFHLPYGPCVAQVQTPPRLAGHGALWREELFEVVHTAWRVEDALGHPVDIEFTFDEGDLVLLQARPITATQQKAVTLPDPGAAVDGRVASMGCATGPVFVLHGPDGIDAVPAGAVLCVGATDPAYLPALKRAAAVLSEEGSPLCHTAIVCRELSIPCLVGVTGARSGRFAAGEVVTVDADRAEVRRGEQPAAPEGTRPASAVFAPQANWCASVEHLRVRDRFRPAVVLVSALFDAYLTEGGPEDAGAFMDFVRRVRRGRHKSMQIHWDVLDDTLAGPEASPFFVAARAALGAQGMLAPAGGG